MEPAETGWGCGVIKIAKLRFPADSGREIWVNRGEEWFLAYIVKWDQHCVQVRFVEDYQDMYAAFARELSWKRWGES